MIELVELLSRHNNIRMMVLYRIRQRVACWRPDG
jgi:hypothetical protein